MAGTSRLVLRYDQALASAAPGLPDLLPGRNRHEKGPVVPVKNPTCVQDNCLPPPAVPRCLNAVEATLPEEQCADFLPLLHPQTDHCCAWRETGSSPARSCLKIAP